VAAHVTGCAHVTDACTRAPPGRECDVASSGTATGTTIATEGQAFSVKGSWITRTATGGGSRSNAWFGNDPAYGIVNCCQVAS
jgi:hypothetical protein